MGTYTTYGFLSFQIQMAKYVYIIKVLYMKKDRKLIFSSWKKKKPAQDDGHNLCDHKKYDTTLTGKFSG